ncbi:hypothetical protein D3C72_2290450 [compost metagenome]
MNIQNTRGALFDWQVYVREVHGSGSRSDLKVPTEAFRDLKANGVLSFLGAATDMWSQNHVRNTLQRGYEFVFIRSRFPREHVNRTPTQVL